MAKKPGYGIDYGEGICVLCEKKFQKRSWSHKWCDECKQEKVKCPTCGKLFTRNFFSQNYCSDSCVGKVRIKEEVKKICPKCKKEFLVPGNNGKKKQKYCSALCARRGGSKRGKTLKCDTCGKEFYCPPHRLKNKTHFCSNPCRQNYLKYKSRVYAWTTKGKAKTRRAFDDIWRKVALKRADYKCEMCGCTEKLNVHHCISRKNYSTRWYRPNSIVLCVSHHMWDIDISAHGNPIAFSKWLLEKRGIGWWEDLLKQKNEIWANWKTKIDDIREHLQREDYVET